jgi:hypothetical protein
VNSSTPLAGAFAHRGMFTSNGINFGAVISEVSSLNVPVCDRNAGERIRWVGGQQAVQEGADRRTVFQPVRLR